jgi:hypothetical protein
LRRLVANAWVASRENGAAEQSCRTNTAFRWVAMAVRAVGNVGSPASMLSRGSLASDLRRLSPGAPTFDSQSGK